MFGVMMLLIGVLCVWGDDVVNLSVMCLGYEVADVVNLSVMCLGYEVADVVNLSVMCLGYEVMLLI